MELIEVVVAAGAVAHPNLRLRNAWRQHQLSATDLKQLAWGTVGILREHCQLAVGCRIEEHLVQLLDCGQLPLL